MNEKAPRVPYRGRQRPTPQRPVSPSTPETSAELPQESSQDSSRASTGADFDEIIDGGPSGRSTAAQKDSHHRGSDRKGSHHGASGHGKQAEATTQAIPAVRSGKDASAGEKPAAPEATTRPGSARDAHSKRSSSSGSGRGQGARAQARYVADSARRLRERLALEGAIRDPGEDARPAPVEQEAGPDRPTPARALSTRVVILSLILIICGFTLFPATTTYVRQQGELRAAKAEVAKEQARQERLTDELKRWDDPEYIQQQARERIGLAKPGEKQYVVKDKPKLTKSAETKVEPGVYRQGLPWGDGLWDSVMRASRP